MSKAEYEVGYGKPPKKTQFKKGQSGCPDGGHEQRRAKKRAALLEENEQKKRDELELRDIIRKLANEKHRVRTADGVEEMAALEIMLRGIVNRAIKSDASTRDQQQALKLFHHAKLLDPPPAKGRPMVLVVNRIKSKEQWAKDTEGERLSRNPLEGIPGAEHLLDGPKKRSTETPD